MGIPTEKVEFSNGARGMSGPAKWDDARFSASQDTAVKIQIMSAKN